MKKSIIRKINKKGFTLAEILIVVAIIGVLTGIGVVVFTGQLEKANEAVDMSTMRNAKTALTLAAIDGDIKTDGTKYYYNPASGTTFTLSKPEKGYGKSKKSASSWWVESGKAFGTPNNGGTPAALALSLDADGNVSYYWGGAYAGQNVLSAKEYQSLSYAEKLAKDLLLIDSLQEQFRSMTYSQIRNLFYDSNGKLKEAFNDKVGYIDGKYCITIANGTVDSDGQITTGTGKTGIYLKDLFNDVGYDTGLSADKTYLINSVPDTTNTLWINLGMSRDELLKESNANKVASKAYTYVKSGGAKTPEELREINRKKL